MIASGSVRRAAPRAGLLIPLVPLQPGPAGPTPAGRTQGAYARVAAPVAPPAAPAAPPAQAPPVGPVPDGGLSGWAAHVGGCTDRAFLLDRAGRFLAVSGPAAELIGGMAPAELAGRPVLECLRLVDFGSLSGDGRLYANRIAPLLSLAGDTPNRGLLRLRGADRIVTVDAVAVPLHDHAGGLVGVLTFLHPLG